MSISVQDYQPDMAVELEDPTDPNEMVARRLMDKLAKLATRIEETLNAGDSDMTVAQLLTFVQVRGDLLDELDDPDIKLWLQNMRQASRCPYRRYTLG